MEVEISVVRKYSKFIGHSSLSTHPKNLINSRRSPLELPFCQWYCGKNYLDLLIKIISCSLKLFLEVEISVVRKHSKFIGHSNFSARPAYQITE